MAVVRRFLEGLGYWRLTPDQQDYVRSERLIACWPELGETAGARVAVELMKRRFPDGGDFRSWERSYPLVRPAVLARLGHDG